MITEPFTTAYIVHFVSFWAYNILWYSLSSRKYNTKKALDVAIFALEVQLTIIPFIGFLFSVFCNRCFVIEYTRYTPIEYIRQAFAMIIWEDIAFYHIHRALHTKNFYKYHKLHHSWTSPVPWEALYASFVENTCANLLPALLAPVVTGTNLYYLPHWILGVTLSSVLAHSGIGKHDIHHKVFKYNYGTLGLCDVLYGTSD